MMVRRREPVVKPPARLTASQMQESIPKIRRRLEELEAFDVSTMIERSDPRIMALEVKYDNTLVEIFGNDTADYDRYSISGLDRAGITIGGTPIQEVREGVRRGIGNAVAKLNSVLDIFEENLTGPTLSPATKASRVFKDLNLHPELAITVTPLFENEHYSNAVEDACKILEAFVKIRSGINDYSGTELMQRVFSPKNPILAYSDLADDTKLSEQQGMMFLFTGVMSALRNPRAHSIVDDNPESAVEMISFINYLLKSLDATNRVKRNV